MKKRRIKEPERTSTDTSTSLTESSKVDGGVKVEQNKKEKTTNDNVSMAVCVNSKLVNILHKISQRM